MAYGIQGPNKSAGPTGGQKAVGALQGAAGGVATGAAIGGPIGAGVGGVVGALPALFGGGGGKAAPQALPTGGAKDAIARRMESMQSDTLKQLEDSAMALAEAPHDIRKEYAAPILTAFEMEAKRRGGVA